MRRVCLCIIARAIRLAPTAARFGDMPPVA